MMVVQDAGPRRDGAAGPRVGAFEGRTRGGAGRAAGGRGRAEEPGPQVLAAAIRGERQALDQVLRTVRPIALGYCRARMVRGAGTIESAEDVAQQVCLNLLRALPRFRADRPLLPFVYAVAANVVTDSYRRATRHRTDELTDEHQPIDPRPGPEDGALHRHLADEVRLLLDTLTPRMREVLVLRVALGLDVRQTARLLGSTPGAVRIAQHRALRALRIEAADRLTVGSLIVELGALTAG